MASSSSSPQGGKGKSGEARPINEGAQIIEVDDAVYDNDSTYESKASTTSGSLLSTVLDFPWEHGRRYHSSWAGNYAMPNDDIELDRLNFTHIILQMAIGDKMFLAPLDTDKVKRVLDLGTGTGIWAIEFGERYPHVDLVLGNDISPIQPTCVPPNVKFEAEDIERTPWVYPEPFDYIFCRQLILSIADWPTLVKSAYESVPPPPYFGWYGLIFAQ